MISRWRRWATSLETGRRLVSAPGNAGQRLELEVRGLVSGEYYWSVQTVDHSFTGSAFSDEMRFVVE